MEYARFGDGWMRRTDVDGDWENCPLDDLPASVVEEEVKKERRRTLGFDPDAPNPGPQVLPNPAVEAMAEELGLGADELRKRLNDAPGGTRVRVSEERFDEIAEKLGISPEDARARFRQ